MLAHFGHFDRGRKAGDKLTGTWEYHAAMLMGDHPQRAVFADLSYSQAALIRDTGNTFRLETVRMLKEMRRLFPLLEQRLLFGTDWSMVGQEEKFVSGSANGGMAATMDDMLEAAGFGADARRAVMFGNAGVFFGLGESGAAPGNAARLRAFYAAHGLPDAWLDDFKPHP